MTRDWTIAPFIQTTPNAKGAWIRNYNRSLSFELNPWELSIWQNLRAGTCLEDIAKRLAAPPSADPAIVRRYVESTVEAFLRSGLLESTSQCEHLLVPRTVLDNLRIVAAPALHEYLVNTALWRKHGNESFAALVVDSERRIESARRDVDVTPPICNYVLYHAWLPGFVHLDLHEARTLMLALKQDAEATQSVMIPGTELTRTWMTMKMDVDHLGKKVTDLFEAIQNAYEWGEFLRLVQDLRPRIVVEIGTARGGVLYCLSQLAERDALLVSIDLPGAPNCGGQTETERQVFASFGPRTQRMRFLPADSHADATRRALERVLAGAKVDLLFIDGDHSYEGVKSDFEMYRGFIRQGGLVVFHDICLFPEEWGKFTAVGVFWREIAAQYETEEIIDPDGTAKWHIGSGERRKWGIGVVRL